MHVTYLSPDRRETWDALVSQSSSFMLMQSWEWGRLKEARGWETIRVAVEDHGQLVAGAQIMVRGLPFGIGSMAYVPRGPVGNWLSDEVLVLLLNELKYIAQKHHAIFLRIEPPILHAPAIGSILLQHGFEPSKFTNQPRATLILDLDKDLVDIMAQMKRSAQRIRHAERCGVIVRRGDQRDLSAFCGLMQETSARCGFSSRTCDYYEEQWDAFSRRDEAVMLLAYGEGQLLGGRMSFRFAEHAASLHACSSLVHSELRANWLLVWEEIKWARALGCRTFDLWGIPNEVGEAAYEGRELPTSGPSSELWGVYQFKRGFTQNVVYYLGAYDYIYAPLLYRPVMQILSNEHLDHLTAKIDSIKSRRMIAKK